ncbi:MAG: hypothetical protein AB7O67_10650 [Vicinamibacterales bacterium]
MIADPDAAFARAARIRAFREELATLQAEGVAPLTDEEVAAVAAHHEAVLAALEAAHDVDRTPAAERLSRGLQLASLFGAITLTAGVGALVAHFWGRFDLWTQVALYAAAPLVALAGGEIAARLEHTGYVASLFGLAALGTCWLAVGGVPSALDMPVQPPMLWGGVLFGLSLAVAYGFDLVLGLSLVALVTSASATAFWANGVVWTAAFERLDPLVAGGATLFLIAQWLGPAGPAVARTTRLSGLLVGGGAALVLSASGEPSVLRLSPAVVEAIYQVAVLLASVGGIVLGLRRGWAETWIGSVVILLLFLLTRYVDWLWEVLPRYAFFLILAALTFVAIAALLRLRARAQRGAA